MYTSSSNVTLRSVAVRLGVGSSVGVGVLACVAVVLKLGVRLSDGVAEFVHDALLEALGERPRVAVCVARDAVLLAVGLGEPDVDSLTITVLLPLTDAGTV
jgi:hypothetical protein